MESLSTFWWRNMKSADITKRLPNWWHPYSLNSIKSLSNYLWKWKLLWVILLFWFLFWKWFSILFISSFNFFFAIFSDSDYCQCNSHVWSLLLDLPNKYLLSTLFWILPRIFKTSICCNIVSYEKINQKIFTQSTLYNRRKTTTTCTKEDIDTCKENFGTFQDVVDYDCKGQCKMCKWCSLAPTLKECKLYCSEGVQGCTNSCEKGRAKCLTCGKNF